LRFQLGFSPAYLSAFSAAKEARNRSSRSFLGRKNPAAYPWPAAHARVSNANRQIGHSPAARNRYIDLKTNIPAHEPGGAGNSDAFWFNGVEQAFMLCGLKTGKPR
jgi:hypothetical protein